MSLEMYYTQIQLVLGNVNKTYTIYNQFYFQHCIAYLNNSWTLYKMPKFILKKVKIIYNILCFNKVITLIIILC